MPVIFSLDIRRHRIPSPASQVKHSGISLKGNNGKCVILIHGLTGTPNEMKSLANFLYKKGYSVVCPTLAYHGDPLDVIKHAKWQDFYGSVRDLLVKGELADFKGDIFVSGLSMGALLSLNIAHEFPDRIKAVSCLAPTLFYDGWNTPWSKLFMPLARTPLRYIFYFKEDPPYGIKNKAMQDRIHRYYKNAKLEDTGNVAQYGYPYFPVALLYQLQLLVKDLTSKLKDIRLPVQMIQAKDDDMTSPRNSQFIYDHISSAVKEIVLLDNSYHVITADQERDTVSEKLEAFFAKA